jgi:hypothetical protein
LPVKVSIHVYVRGVIGTWCDARMIAKHDSVRSPSGILLSKEQYASFVTVQADSLLYEFGFRFLRGLFVRSDPTSKVHRLCSLHVPRFPACFPAASFLAYPRLVATHQKCTCRIV